MDDGDGIRPVQSSHGLLHGQAQIAPIQAVDQVGDDLGVGLAVKRITQGLQFGAQFVVVFDDAVVHQGHAARGVHIGRSWTGTEVGVRVAHRRCPMGGPAGVGDAGGAGDVIGLDLGHQLGHAIGAARAPQATTLTGQAVVVHGNPARVIASVFESLQALNQDAHDVLVGGGADDDDEGPGEKPRKKKARAEEEGDEDGDGDRERDASDEVGTRLEPSASPSPRSAAPSPNSKPRSTPPRR